MTPPDAGYTYDPSYQHEVSMCGMKTLASGDQTYAETHEATFWSVCVKVYKEGGEVDILEDEDFDREEAAGERASELIAKYGGEDKCDFESY